MAAVDMLGLITRYQVFQGGRGPELLVVRLLSDAAQGRQIEPWDLRHVVMFAVVREIHHQEVQYRDVKGDCGLTWGSLIFFVRVVEGP